MPSMEENKAVIYASYPNAVCVTVPEMLGDVHYIIPENVSLADTDVVLDYSVVSEEDAWRRAATYLLKRMITTLEN